MEEKNTPKQSHGQSQDTKDKAPADKPPEAITPEQIKHHRHKFLAGLWDLTWRLALVLILPILLGYWLDRGRETPVFTLIGVALGITGAIFVIKKTSDEYSDEVELDA